MIGVSQATLSLVVNNKPGISEKTRTKVIGELKARGFDYLLDESAVNAYAARSDIRMLGFVTFQVGGELTGYNSFFPLIISGIEAAASQAHYNVAYININREKMEEGIRQIRSSGCSGYVIFATEMKAEDLEPFQALGIPFVILDNYFLGQGLNTAKVNNEQGMYCALKYLFDNGHRKIGYLRSGVDINSFHERYAKAMEIMHLLGCETPEAYTYEIGYPSENAFDGMQKLLREQKSMPTAFVGDNDLVIAGAMKAMLSAGYKLPKDMSFVGFDDRPVCEWLEPALTTVRLPRENFGGEVLKILIRMLNDEPDLRIKVEINSELIVRDSVAKLK